jgi:hypothetical protein
MALVACEGTTDPQLNVSDAQPDDLQVAANTLSENPFLGAWRLTSVVQGEDEVILRPHFWFIVDFRSDGTSWAFVSGDDDHLICEAPDTSCSWPGTYTFTRTIFTGFDEEGPEPGEDSMFYAFCANKMILMDKGDGEGIRFTWERTRRDCYVTDCT